MYDDDKERVGHSTTNFAAYGLSDPKLRRGERTDSNTPKTNPLVDHPAVLSYRAEGISTTDLVSFIESFASLRGSRVKKIGHEQYSLDKGQKFEEFTFNDTIRELIEELADASNYIDFLAIKLLNLASSVQDKGPDCD